MKGKYLLFSLSLATIILLSLSSVNVVSAATVYEKIQGKGAIAQFSVAGPGGLHTINAIVSLSNSEKDGQVYISIVHPLKGTSVAAGPANIKWNMNHVTIQATLTFTGAAGRIGTHEISIVWQTEGQAKNGELSENTGKGLIAEINGTWKTGLAEFTMSDSSGHHTNSVYTSSWATIVHGTSDIILTQ